jgi:hypothetical protein
MTKNELSVGQTVTFIDENGSPFPAFIYEKLPNGRYIIMMEYRQNGDVKIETSADNLKPWGNRYGKERTLTGKE